MCVYVHNLEVTRERLSASTLRDVLIHAGVRLRLYACLSLR